MILPLATIIRIHTLDAVGLGTLLLALATFILAGLTLASLRAAKQDRKLANDALKASQAQADIAQAALDAEHQPLLIEVLPYGEPPPPEMPIAG